MNNKNPVYIIAEVGSNHDGKLSKAKILIKAAAITGANAVKFQLYTADTIFSKQIIQKKYPNLKKTYQYFKARELPPAWIPKLIKTSRKHNLDFLCTPFYLKAVDFLVKNRLPAFKSFTCYYPGGIVSGVRW